MLFGAFFFKGSAAEAASYECGADPAMPDRPKARMPFYRTALLFLVLELEIVLMFPVLPFVPASAAGPYLFIMFFLFSVQAAVLFELRSGALSWSATAGVSW